MRAGKYAALLTASVLAVSSLPLKVLAADGLSLEIGYASAEAKAGETVTLQVNAEENPGYLAGRADLCWDSDALTLKKVEFDEENAPDNGAAPIVSDGSYCLFFGNSLAKENFTGTGAFFTLVFEVTANASEGDYAVILSAPNVIDTELKAVDVTASAGCISLTGGTAADDALHLEIGSTEALFGDSGEIRVPVRADRNPGFIAGTIDLLWNADVLTLTKVEYSGIAPDFGSAEIVSDGNYRIAFGDLPAKKDITDNGVMFTLVFKPGDGAAPGVYKILLGNADVQNAAVSVVPVIVTAGSVVLKAKTTTTATATTTAAATTTTKTTTTTSGTATTTKATTSTGATTTTTVTTNHSDPPGSISGDYNGDGEVTAADAVLLARFAGEDPALTAEQIGRILNAEPDQDEDGLVTILDAAAILRKL